jgi:hypothetical protein
MVTEYGGVGRTNFGLQPTAPSRRIAINVAKLMGLLKREKAAGVYKGRQRRLTTKVREMKPQGMESIGGWRLSSGAIMPDSARMNQVLPGRNRMTCATNSSSQSSQQSRMHGKGCQSAAARLRW